MKSSTTEDGTDSSRVIIQACRTIRDSFVEYEAGQQDSPKADSVREACLQEVRQTVSRQIVKDADYNLLRLRDWTAEVSSTIGMDLSKQALVADLLDRIRAGRDFLTDTDASVSSRVEEQCWLALQQFYIDGLDLAEYLHSCREKGVVPRSPKVLNGGGIRRREILGISSYSWIRTATLAMDVAVPNWTQMRFCRSMLPTLVHLLWHQLVPWGPLCWCDFERTTLGWLRPDGFARLRGQRGNIAEFQRREIVDDNPQLFDRQTRKTHHNVILVGAHRLGFLDFPFWTEMFRRTDHAVWANNAFYGPGMAKKLARGRTTVPIRGVGRMPLEQALDRSISILAEDRMPLFIIADGSQPNMMYGDQKRVKRGLRLLVDECVRQTRSKGRRTFVIPITFDDPLGYLMGYDDLVTTKLHPPLEIVEPTTEERYTSVFDDSAFNGGDPLLNHLEGLFVANCMMSRHGLRVPDVIDTVTRRHLMRRTPGVRGWLRSRLRASTFDLSSSPS